MRKIREFRLLLLCSLGLTSKRIAIKEQNEFICEIFDMSVFGHNLIYLFPLLHNDIQTISKMSLFNQIEQ